MMARPGSRTCPASSVPRAGSARSTASAPATSSGASCPASARTGRGPGLKTSNRGPPAPVRARLRARSAGISPARSNDDLPAPEGPTTTSGNSRAWPPVLRYRSAARPTSGRIRSSRPKNQRASSAWKAARPRYGAGAPAGRRPGALRARASACSHSSMASARVSPQAARIRRSREVAEAWGRWLPVK